MKPRLVTSAAVAALAIAAHARAEPPDRARAEQLFQDARKLLESGHPHEACIKLEDARRLDPYAGGTVLALALCHEQDGAAATALATFREALALARRANRSDRVDVAEKHIKDLEADVSRLTIVARETPDLVITVDGAPWDAARWNTAIPIDGGSHEIRATVPKHAPWIASIAIAPRGDSPRVEIPPFADEAPRPAPPPPRAEKPAPVVVKSSASTQRTIGFVVGGVGIAALAVGGYFGVRAITKRSDALSHCTGGFCSPEGLDLDDQSKSAATVANITVAGGLAAVAVGVVLVLTAKPDASARTAIVPGPGLAGIGVARAF